MRVDVSNISFFAKGLSIRVLLVTKRVNKGEWNYKKSACILK